MAKSLRDFLYGYKDEVKVPKELVVYNTDTLVAENGGACCLFTIPGGTTIISGEIWGGGGAGDGSCCYGFGYPGGAGGYVEFAQTVVPGDQVTICAAGSTASFTRNLATQGFDTYICKENEWCIFAAGGCRGCATCNAASCYNCRCSVCDCRNTTLCGPGAGTSGTVTSAFAYCGIDSITMNTSTTREAAIAIAQSGRNMPPRISPPFYFGCNGGESFFGYFPGGGGLSAQTCCANTGGACSGGPGAGGLAYIIYE